MKQIHGWSFTKVMDFERCKFYAFLKYACHIKEPERPLLPGQTEQANDRGSRLHAAGESYARGLTPKLDPGLKSFAPEFDELRAGYAKKQVILEDEWGLDRDWNKVEWKSAWLRLKLDAKYKLNPYHAAAIDYKSGRKEGNEAKHGQQLQLYALATVSLDHVVEEVTCEAWYLDKNEITSVTYPRAVAISFKRAWHKRGAAVTDATDFPPSPNKYSCRYCQYGPWNGGQCQAGVR